ncbi:hypothetical protein ABPG74_006661 [Tetrahymena malaccensis]
MNTLKVLVSLLLVSSILCKGADVTCTSTTCGVPACGAAASGSWTQGSTAQVCAIDNCPASVASGLTGATDNFCTSCPGATNGSTKAVFANSAGTACVAAAYSCLNRVVATNKWTDADCAVCTPTTPKMKSDGSGCQAASGYLLIASLLSLIALLI